METRHYSSPIREEASASTRLRIVGAAAVLFARDGYQSTTMAAIAKEAGVSVQSVHLAGPKSALLIAAFEISLAGDEGTHPLHERPAVAAIMQLPPREALPAYIEFLTEANSRTAGIDRALYVAAETDDAVAALVEDLNARRHSDIRMAITWLEAHGLLWGNVDPEERTETLTYIVAPATYRFFVYERGWTRDHYQRWMSDVIDRLVLRSPEQSVRDASD